MKQKKTKKTTTKQYRENSLERGKRLLALRLRYDRIQANCFRLLNSLETMPGLELKHHIIACLMMLKADERENEGQPIYTFEKKKARIADFYPFKAGTLAKEIKRMSDDGRMLDVWMCSKRIQVENKETGERLPRRTPTVYKINVPDKQMVITPIRICKEINRIHIEKEKKDNKRIYPKIDSATLKVWQREYFGAEPRSKKMKKSLSFEEMYILLCCYFQSRYGSVGCRRGYLCTIDIDALCYYLKKTKLQLECIVGNLESLGLLKVFGSKKDKERLCRVRKWYEVESDGWDCEKVDGLTRWTLLKEGKYEIVPEKCVQSDKSLQNLKPNFSE